MLRSILVWLIACRLAKAGGILGAHLPPHCKAQHSSQPPQDHVDDAADAEEDLHPCQHPAHKALSDLPVYDQKLCTLGHCHIMQCSAGMSYELHARRVGICYS